jgi:O-antigen/teichoic acid export membrane protein
VSAIDGAEPGVDVLDTPAAGPAAIRGGALRAGGYALGLLLALGSAPLIFRHLGVAEFGRYTAVLSLVTLAAGFSEGGLNAIALREWATASPDHRRALIANLLGIRVTLSLVAVAAAVAFAAVAGYGSALVAGTVLAGGGMLLQTAQTLLASPLQAELRFGWATAAELLRQVTLVACIVVLVLAGAGVLPLLGAQLPAGLTALALTAWLVRGSVPFRPRADRAVWGPLLRDTLPYALAIAINIAYFRVALLYVSIASTALATGYFATSFRIVEVVIAVPPVLLAAAFPILSRAARDDAGRFAYATGRLFDVALIVGGLAAVGLELGARIAVDVLAGAGYEEAVPILRIQAPAVLATFAAVACAYPLLSLRRHREVLLANGLALAVTIVALVTLVGPHGARGAAVATLAAEVTLAVAMAVLLLRSHIAVRLSAASVAWVLGAGTAAVVVARASGLPDVAQVALGLALYCGALLVARRVPRELLEAVRR